MFGRRRRQNRRGIGGGLVPFLPTQLSGCVLWLRADLGITKDGSDRVSAWADQSGLGHDVTQGTAAAQPLYEGAGLGGRPSVYGDGVDDFLAVSFTLAQPTTVIAAAQVLTTVDNATLWDGYGVNKLRCYSGSGADPTWKWYAAPFGSTGSTRDLNANVLSAIYAASGASFGKNGTYTAGTVGPQSGDGVTLFNWHVGPTPAHMRYGEFIVYDRALSAPERLQVERYMGARYGITVA